MAVVVPVSEYLTLLEPHFNDVLTLQQVKELDDSTHYVEIQPSITNDVQYWGKNSVYIHQWLWVNITNLDVYDDHTLTFNQVGMLIHELQQSRTRFDKNNSPVSITITKLIGWLNARQSGVLILGV